MKQAKHALRLLAFAIGAAAVAQIPAGMLAAQDRVGRQSEHAKLFTDDATPVDAGSFEIEIGYAFVGANRQWDNRWRTSPRGEVREHAIEVAVAYGVAENLDAGIGLGIATLHDGAGDPGRTTGLCDLGIGLKWRFLNREERKLSLAYLPGITIPTGTGGISEEVWIIEQVLALSKDIAPCWTLNADFGCSLPLGEKSGGPPASLEAGLAFGWQLSDRVQAEAELAWEHGLGDEADVVGVTAGVIMSLGAWRGAAGSQVGVAGRNADANRAVMAALAFGW